ncbi:MAG: Ig-like domain-containing protein, partial [Caldilineaceae bacterium]|nr:Ig-like domain-containing protein [Caldilineaceae bacterium]
FKLVRNGPTAAYLIPNFTDVVLHHGGLPDYPDTYTTTLELPSTVSNFDTFYLLGSYFQNPKVYFNTKLVRPFTPGSINPVDDEWTLAVQHIPSNRVFAGPNTVQYDYSSGWGQFIEEPGPMVVFRRANTAGFSDTAAPVASGFEPTNGATNVDRFQPVVAYVSDGLGVGVDITTLKLKIDGNAVPAQITGFSDSYKLTYSKPGGFTHSTDYTVTVEAKDLLNNTMTPTSFSFRIEDPDFTPPVISNTQVITSFTQAVISWETDEPATSKVSFGTTASYTGTVEDTNYVTSHKLTIPNLHSNALYHFAITSVDSDNNSATTPDATFTTPLRIAMVTDDFNACALDPMWEFVNPRNDASVRLNGQELIISVPGGVGHDIWSNGTPIIRAPHVVQNVTDPNQLLVKFASGVTQAIQQQGILAIQDPDNFMRINFQYVAGEVQVVMVRVRDGNARVVKSATVTGASPSGPLYLFLTRDEDNRWRPRYSLDGSNWNNFGTVNEIYAINKVGIYAGNASDGGPV